MGKAAVHCTSTQSSHCETGNESVQTVSSRKSFKSRYLIDLADFNECRMLILHSLMKYNIINHHNYGLFQLSLLGEKLFGKCFQCNST